MSNTLPEMQYRFLGRTGLKVSVISLGSWLTYGGHVGNETALECMKVAYDAGVNFFDTAEVYSGGQSEIVLGEAIKKFGWKQNDLVISTKIYWGKANSAHPDRPLNNTGLSRKHIIEGMNFSLQRLDLPYVDIVYAHRPDRDTPMEEIVRGFNYLIDNGKAFYWGTSEWSASEISDAWRIADKLGLVGPVVEQPQYNLLARERVEKEYRWLYESHGLGLTVFSPLKGGVLTGKYNNAATPPPGSRLAESEDGYVKGLRKTVGDETWQRQLDQVAALMPVAEELGVTTAQLALAWILKNPNISSMITGASRPQQVIDNIQALAIVEKLTDEVVEKIEIAVGNKPAVETRRY
ncbi:Potassium channel, voltage-dependent, beta subunit, KCNAB-related protein [Penicillium griseofulvum]|uniref:Potassium channel, voltage-dependent, beta subunit, KCNAB-related protein n=1 Tax=Penicillium patulum TaxID=5078 RepID=A0A135LLJ5_PENPA|nr:Potassium channel, voltage-dependent, beta subunit, KCNAB-related protein [Penicillium griseofulvum]KXG49842.1 Potassium channel, voltage-dependent, beta subunit, KCNAB-related protein [Penicillium griseofulvum]